MGLGLNSAESIVVLLEQKKKTDPPNKNLVKETVRALRRIEGLGNCLEVASTVSELFFGTIFIKNILTLGLKISLQ